MTGWGSWSLKSVDLSVSLQGRSLAFVMRAFTLRSAERQVELQEVPPGLSDHRSANAGAASANEHLPAATQVRSFFLSKPGWIGLTIILPLLFCFISAGVWRTIRHTSRTNAQQSTEHLNRSFIKNPGRSNQNQISSVENSLLRKGSSSVQVQQSQSQPPANSQQPPIDASKWFDTVSDFTTKCSCTNVNFTLLS